MLNLTTTNKPTSPTIDSTKNIEWLTPRRIDGNIATIIMRTTSEKEKRFRREIDRLYGK